MTLSPRELSAQNTKLQRDQEKLIQDLLGILDDLDNACEHWQQAEQDYADPVVMPIDPPTPEQLSDDPYNDLYDDPYGDRSGWTNTTQSPSLWQRLQRWLQRLWQRLCQQLGQRQRRRQQRQRMQEWLSTSLETADPAPSIQVNTSITPDAEVVASAREGVEMIRRSLLDVLRRQQVVPLDVLGKTFDPAQMYAMGRQESADAEENTVVQEVVRGYLWQNRVLRESRVMVAVKPVDSDEMSE
jgi:molecular chaperone GrpE (heat shock protein)